MHPSTSTVTSVLHALRAATEQAHLRLEATVDIKHCLQDRQKYAGLLRTFLGFYRPLEGRLEAVSGLEEVGYVLSERRKTLWLEADLRSLGMSGAEIDTLPDCLALPSLDTLTRAFGCLYVLEGATLGGRHITSLMLDSAVPTEARRFFASYGTGTGTRWREFIAMLEAEGKMGGSEIIAAARETFADMDRWINERMLRA